MIKASVENEGLSTKHPKLENGEDTKKNPSTFNKNTQYAKIKHLTNIVLVARLVQKFDARPSVIYFVYAGGLRIV